MNWIWIGVLLIVFIFIFTIVRSNKLIGGAESTGPNLIVVAKKIPTGLSTAIQKECGLCNIIKCEPNKLVDKLEKLGKSTILADEKTSNTVRLFQKENPLKIKGMILINPPCDAGSELISC